MSSLRHSYNLEDVRGRARRALPGPIWHYLEGGADDEWTMRRNAAAFDNWMLKQSILVDVSRIDTNVRLLGLPSTMPLILSPTGMSQLFHADGELAVARAAAAAGVPYGLSTMGTTSIEAVAGTGAERYFQLYMFRDRELTKALLERAAANGYGALCLTVDTHVAGNRERDRRSGMVIPPRFTLAGLASFASRPRWTLGALRNGPFRLANVEPHIGRLERGTSIIDYVNRQFDRSAVWRDLEWLRKHWNGVLAVKGVAQPSDCEQAIACGADALFVSNHGGRQLDGAAAPLDCIAPIRDRIQDGAQLILDGGVRRGTHILKAIALGADGCAIGRPYLYGLAAAGEAGVAHVLSILKSEVERGLALLGRTEISAVGAGDIQSCRQICAGEA